ncbi:IS630 family transposase [Arachidicoccus soli]|uniref:IS630 family transposase n=1 Tax=Arachidicoccus soli TaxID=2341117 RepID=A0A386HKY7_9BACT|nr:IS630 family transposase [Arachidicoccus soli]
MALKSPVKYSEINLYFQDESRFGLFTKNGKALTARGVKPICPFQQVFQSTYLFGAFSPITGDKLLLELPHCNADWFQIFLDHLSNLHPNEYKIVVLDNGAFHHSKKLKIPENISLLFLPPYSPELNPAEKMWAKYKRAFTNRLHKSLEQLSIFIEEVVKNTSKDIVISTCAYSYIFEGLFWTN